MARKKKHDKTNDTVKHIIFKSEYSDISCFNVGDVIESYGGMIYTVISINDNKTIIKGEKQEHNVPHNKNILFKLK